MPHTNDAAVVQSLITTLEDGAAGYALAADRSEHPELAVVFRELSIQRSMASDHLVELAATHDAEMDTDGSILGSLHRTWLSMKDAVTDAEPISLIETCVRGDEHALSVFQDALARDLSPELRAIVEEQFAEIEDALVLLHHQLVYV